jgi:hypothetical protein
LRSSPPAERLRRFAEPAASRRSYRRLIGKLSDYFVLHLKRRATGLSNRSTQRCVPGLRIDELDFDAQPVAPALNAALQCLRFSSRPICFRSTCFILYVKTMLRPITNEPEMRHRSAVRLSVPPSTKYSRSVPPPRRKLKFAAGAATAAPQCERCSCLPSSHLFGALASDPKQIRALGLSRVASLRLLGRTASVGGSRLRRREDGRQDFGALASFSGPSSNCQCCC